MANSLTAYNTTKPPPIGYTSLQPPLVPPSHSPAQRLSIAKAAWNNLFSKEHTDSFPRQPSSHSLRTARIATTPSPTTPLPRQTIMTAKNHRTNTSWGDPLAGKPTNVTRLYCLNVNGLSLDRRGGKFDKRCKITKEVQADIVCCQELNLDITRTMFAISCMKRHVNIGPNHAFLHMAIHLLHSSL